MKENVQKKPHVRGQAVMYSLGRLALLLMAAVTIGDIVRVYYMFGTEYAVGMMIPRMGVLLGSTGSGIQGVLCLVAAYFLLSASILFALLAGRKYFWSVAALVLFSLDTLVAVWMFSAAPGLGFLPMFLLHIAVEVCLIMAVTAGRNYKNTGHSVRAALKLALFGKEIQ